MNSKILLLNKHKGTTSNNQLQKLKKALGQSKAGFSGTLDPLASGVLPIFFNNSTKLIQYVPEKSKIWLKMAYFYVSQHNFRKAHHELQMAKTIAHQENQIEIQNYPEPLILKI